jgi:hypothetical protein
MTSIRQAIRTAREDVSPLCRFGDGWQFFWSSRRGREQSYPTQYPQARRARSARIAGIAAQQLACERKLFDPSDACSYAEERVYNGYSIEEAVRSSINTVC